MSLTLSRASTVALAAAAPLLGLTVAGPAYAGPPDMTSSRTSGGDASAYWTEYDQDDLLRAPGNVHTGYLYVYKQPGYQDVSGGVTDWQCDPGEVPGGGGHDGEGGCDHMGFRWLSGYGTTVFTADSTGATLTGTLTVTNHEGNQAQPAVDMTWVPGGAVTEFRNTSTWTDGTRTYRSRVTGLESWQNTMSGAIGGMGFDDDDDDGSSGSFRVWREMSRTTIR